MLQYIWLVLLVWWLSYGEAASTASSKTGTGNAAPERSALKLPKVQKVPPELIVCSILLQVCVEAPIVLKVKAAGPPFVHHGHQRQFHLVYVWEHCAQELAVSRRLHPTMLNQIQPLDTLHLGSHGI